MNNNLPSWDQLSDLDKGAALLHLHKREWEGSDYAVEHYPARFIEDPKLIELDEEEASEYAAGFWREEQALTMEEHERLYNLALDWERN